MASAQSAAAFDFRSDTATVPTARMLAAMTTATLGDDVLAEDPLTTSFEARFAEMLGHEAGLFVASGTMGNQLGIRTHLMQPPHSVLCDYRAHMYTHEAGGISSLSQAMIIPVRPKNGVHLTLEDVKRDIVLSDDVHDTPTRVISLENTLTGAIFPLEETRRISAFAGRHGVKMHLDGARLWNSVSAGAGTLKEFGKEFDSVSVCFSKGLGAPIGSLLVGKKEFIRKARWIRKSIGGGMRQTGPIIAAAQAAFDDVYPKLSLTHDIAKELSHHFSTLGLSMVLPVDTNMLLLDLELARLKNRWLVEEGAKLGIKLGDGGRIVIHHQISAEAVAALKKAVETVVQKNGRGEYAGDEEAEVLGYGSLKK